MYYYPIFYPQAPAQMGYLSSSLTPDVNYPFSCQLQHQSQQYIDNSNIVPFTNFSFQTKPQQQQQVPIIFQLWQQNGPKQSAYSLMQDNFNRCCKKNNNEEPKETQKGAQEQQKARINRWKNQRTRKGEKEIHNEVENKQKSRQHLRTSHPGPIEESKLRNQIDYNKPQGDHGKEQNLKQYNQEQKESEEQINSSYPKKNTESNIVNQIFSFVSTESKSCHILQEYLGNNTKKIKSFYQILKSIKKRKKKYINRKYIISICTLKEQDVGYKMLLRAKNKVNVLSIQEFQKILLILIFYYLRNQAQINVITSKKINKSTYVEHLQRRRQIKIYLINSLKTSMNQISEMEQQEKDEEIVN